MLPRPLWALSSLLPLLPLSPPRPWRLNTLPPPDPTRRPCCPVCQHPQRTCLCLWVRPVQHATEVLILQHPLEVGHAKNTARLLHLSLAHSRLLVGECWDCAAVAAAGLSPLPTLLLYPRSTQEPADEDAPDGVGAGARARAGADVGACAVGGAGAGSRAGADAASGACMAAGAGLRLVVLDATWRKSRKMLHLSPWLQGLPRCSLDGPPASRYAIRKAHQPGQLSTLEAVCEALAQLEGDASRFQPLLAAFDGFVAQQLAFRPSAHRPG